MIVHEELQVAADDEGVKELFVDDRELLDPVVLPRVEDLEGEVDRLVRLRRLRRDGQIQVVLGRVGNAGDERHAAARTLAGIVRADVAIHRTDVGEIAWTDSARASASCGRGGRLPAARRLRCACRPRPAPTSKQRRDRRDDRIDSIVVPAMQRIVRP